MRLHLLRHGPTEAGAQGATLGRLDLPVTPAGQALWPRVKEELLLLGIQRVLTSDLGRARLHALDLGLPTLVLPGLGEQHFGDWDGIPWPGITRAEGFFKDPVHTEPPGGESFAACASRAVAALGEGLDPAVPTLVLAHGGSLRAILAHLLGLPLDRALDLAWAPFGLTGLDLYLGDRAVLAFHNLPLPAGRAPGML